MKCKSEISGVSEVENNGIKYEFTAKVYNHSTSADMSGWTMVSLPKEISTEIRNNFKQLEQGWGRMKVTAKIGESEWQTAIWFDTKQDTYLLPLKAVIRKKENVALDNDVDVAIWV
jgi:hypothetical protein